MPTALTPKAKTRMFCRMMRTVSRRQPEQQRQRRERIAHEHDVAGLGGDVGAAAADRQADVGRASAGASLMPSPTMATADGLRHAR